MSAHDGYQGVRALFNADLHAVASEWAPREEWSVLRGDVIVHDRETVDSGSSA